MALRLSVSICGRLLQRSLPMISTISVYRQIKYAAPTVAPTGNLWTRLKKKVGLASDLRYTRRNLMIAGENLYAFSAEYPMYEEFISRLNLPDTFQSWFSITSLHMWICLVRLKSEGEDGRISQEVLFQTLFKDIGTRSRMFHPNQRQKQIELIQKQLYGALFAYDEGLLSGEDHVLAGALWRCIFHMSEDTEPWVLDLMVQYVHKQLRHLDGQSAYEILNKGIVTFLPLIGDELDEDYANKRIKYTLSRPAIKG